MKAKARLLLEDGTLFTGKSFGAEGDSVGEVVFNTGITGYQEVLSDPSYCGQIVTMTYPLIGNYGISRDDFESVRPFVHGFVVRRHEEAPSNWRAQYTLGNLLKEYGIIGISDIDTRMLTRKIRHHGVMKGLLTTSDRSVEELKEMLQTTPLMTTQVSTVSTPHVFSAPGNRERVVLVDFGAKSGIVRDLTKRGCDVVVVPQDSTAEQIMRLAPDGVLLSNGPGDPKDVPHAVETVRQLLGQVPVFGICLGHQLFALACGADTEKLKFGHRGGNHPVKDLISGRCYITSQNHGYTVKEESIAGTELTVTHINNNDRTIEGLKHNQYPAFSVQYHPEAAPGPFDSSYLFDDFLTMIRSHQTDNPQAPRQAQMLAAWKAEQSDNTSKGELHYAQK
ncbi:MULTISPECIES: glutamine-hydrolyzing carbamoyl-phosphate synthase small subunit [Paenibacillus]|uniref:glutamine-hydrolyzing carbamoyl-phosphate synthase small subunit n=1 Tax=Paenibacillus TaxID=44249 RepID=UPI00020D79EF|nr:MULTISPECIES: glutamine-hydrolyzing carbamoyl-phosphate synthase small subunit [Paenibacillus]EGL19757.1 carbamoyl-phosphate synthase, small subunit [Paenibacillus sp. HGF7]EPD92252.1 carbamoyl-phosphate synthase, small subunit [Paenibacillus sp. HGH0039]MBV6712736.1 glutamine-hydrolyzing carbamoyl-phosphate synthase small subunit [Paenibacillus chitinolyticus]GKS12550.1 carbamoyl-phosphate synthase pyrimidine-specific small chain [Paenibacillus chitinolyticus]